MGKLKYKNVYFFGLHSYLHFLIEQTFFGLKWHMQNSLEYQRII